MKIKSAAFLIVFLTAGTAYAAPLSEKEQAARLPADLGPETIDVIGYPAFHQENYRFFRNACSICHTTARAVNAPFTTHSDWTRYVRRMHLKAQEQLLSKHDAQRLVDFLVYDSYERKIQNKTAFDTLQKTLHARFEEVQKEKAELLRKKKPPIKESVPYTGAP